MSLKLTQVVGPYYIQWIPVCCSAPRNTTPNFRVLTIPAISGHKKYRVSLSSRLVFGRSEGYQLILSEDITNFLGSKMFSDARWKSNTMSSDRVWDTLTHTVHSTFNFVTYRSILSKIKLFTSSTNICS